MSGALACVRACVRVPSLFVLLGTFFFVGVRYLVYTELVIKSLSPFQLISLPDGRSVMRAAPYVEAWSHDHVWLQVVPGIFGILGYVVFVPVAMLVYVSRFT